MRKSVSPTLRIPTLAPASSLGFSPSACRLCFHPFNTPGAPAVRPPCPKEHELAILQSVFFPTESILDSDFFMASTFAMLSSVWVLKQEEAGSPSTRPHIFGDAASLLHPSIRELPGLRSLQNVLKRTQKNSLPPKSKEIHVNSSASAPCGASFRLRAADPAFRCRPRGRLGPCLGLCSPRRRFGRESLLGLDMTRKALLFFTSLQDGAVAA